MKRIIFALLIVIPFYTNAQSESPHFGFKVEFYSYTLQDIFDTTYSKKSVRSSDPSMYILFIMDLSESMSLILKPGLLLVPKNFKGFELGLIADYKVSNNIFLNGGINLHIPPGISHGIIYYEKTHSSPPIFFILFGIGYRIRNDVYIDIAYHHALNPEFGHTSYNYPPYASGPLKLNNMLKFGLTIAP